MHLNSLPGLDKLKQLKDSHLSVACTDKAFSWHSQAGRSCDSPPYFNSRNQACKALEWRPGCDSGADMSSEHLRLLFRLFSTSWSPDRALTQFLLKPTKAAVGAGWHPVPAGVKCYPCLPAPGLLPLQLRATLASASLPQLSRMARASPAQTKQLQSTVTVHAGHDCHHPLAPWPLPASQPQEHATSCAHIFYPKEALRGFFGTAHTGSEQLPLASMFTSLWLLI